MTEYFGQINVEDISKNPEDFLAKIKSEIPVSLIQKLGVELEHQFHKLLPTLQSFLAFPTLTKSIQKIFSAYIKQTKDKETILAVLIKCLYNLSWKTRLASLHIIARLALGLDAPLHQMKALLSALNYLQSDSSSLVASKAALLIKELPEPAGSKELVGNQTMGPLAFNPQGLSEGLQTFQEIEAQNGLVFNLVERSVISEIENEGNWRARSLAVQKLENAIDSLETLDSLIPFLAILLRLVSRLIKDKNFKVSETALSISEKLIKCRELSSVGNFALIVPSCLEKLGDNKISIRMTSFRVLKGLLSVIRPSVMQTYLTSSLESANWHIREEVVGLIITGILSGLDFELSELVEPLARLLDDSRPKVRTVAIEAFAVLHVKNSSLVDSLGQILDAQVLARITARLQNKSIARMTEDYLEYPKLILVLPSTSPQDDTRDEIFSARLELPSQTQEISLEPRRPVSQLKSKQSLPVNQSVPIQSFPTVPNFPSLSSSSRPENTKTPTKSYNFLPKRLTPNDPRQDSETCYLVENELEPVKNPHDLLQRILSREDNWEVQFESVNLLRRLTKHHPEVFFSKVTLHNVVLDVVKWADSLRSSLAKNSLILIEEMCRRLRRSMDSEVSDLMKILIKKAVDTNAFISEQAQKTLEIMLKSLSEHRVVPFLLFHCTNTKNPAVKARLALCFACVFNRMKENVSKIRDVEKCLQILAEYLADASADVRKCSFLAFEELAKALGPELDLLLIRSLKDSLFQRVQNSLSKSLRTQSPQKSISDSRLKSNKFKLRRHFPKFELKKSEEDLSKVFSKILESDWKSRFDSITSISRISDFSKSVHLTLSQSESIVNTLSIGLNDPNVKVQVHSLVTLKKVIPQLKSLLNPYLLQVLQELCKLMGSQSQNLRESAAEVLPLLANSCDLEILILAVVSQLVNSRARARICLLRFLTGKVMYVGEDDLKKMIDALMENLQYPRQDVRAEAEICLLALVEFLKEKVFEYVDENGEAIVRKVIMNKD